MQVTPFEIFPIANCNLRTGPGIAFEIKSQIPVGYELTAKNQTKDGGDNTWYETDEGWINAKYVKQANQVDSKVRSKLKSYAEGLESVTSMTEKLTGISLTNVLGSSGIGSGGINAGVLGSLTGITSSGSQDAILARRIFGTPFQFIADTDMRPTDGPLGLEFVNNIMSETPIVSILPGIPNYLAELSADEKSALSKGLVEMITDQTSKVADLYQDKLDDKNLDIAFFSFTSQVADYVSYVNLLCRMCAVYMGLGNVSVPGGTTSYSTYNWFNWHLSNAYANQSTQTGDSEISLENLKKMGTKGIDSISDAWNGTGLDGWIKVKKSQNGIADNGDNNSVLNPDSYFFDFFIRPPSYQESFSNTTAPSAFSSALTKGSEIQRELNFLFGGMLGADTKMIKENTANGVKALGAGITKAFDSPAMRKIMNRLVVGAQSVITGANIIFPEIWQSSSYNRDFNVDIVLSTPYGDPESIFLNIMVPWMHLLALVLPRQATVNSYGSPFLVRTCAPGFYSSEMGIVTELSITKGGQSGECWSAQGFPTEVNISMNIKDLYNALSMSNFRTRRGIWNTLYNAPLLDYIGVQCGLNMKSSEWSKKIALIKSLLSNVASDQADYTITSARELAAMSKMKILAAKG